MAAATDSYEGWLAQAHLPEHRLRPEQQVLLQAAFRFRQSQESTAASGKKVNPLKLLGWLVALVYNAAADWAASLAGDWAGCHVRTLRRTFWDRPGTLYQTPEVFFFKQKTAYELPK